MFGKVRKAAVVLVSALLVSACSSSGTFTMKQQLVEPINSQKTVSIWVKTNNVPQGEKEDADLACPSLQDKLYSRLVTSGLFRSSVVHPNKGDYNLEVDVVGVRMVSNTAKIFAGIMTGASGIEANVLLRDETGKVLTEFHADGSSANHPFSMESGSDNAVLQLSNKIVEALKKN